MLPVYAPVFNNEKLIFYQLDVEKPLIFKTLTVYSSRGKGTVSVFLSNPSCKEASARFTTVRLTLFSLFSRERSVFLIAVKSF